jgi:hypothetical protein
MTKEDRANQARINGAKSKGAKTAEGKAKCQEAASKPRKRFLHATALPGEDLQTCEAARLALHAEFQPATFQQAQMVDELASINWYIRREMYGRNMDVVRAYDHAAQSAVQGSTKAELVADAERTAHSDGTNQPYFDRSLQGHILMRNRIMTGLLRLQKHEKNAPKLPPPVETQDLAPEPSEPTSAQAASTRSSDEPGEGASVVRKRRSILDSGLSHEQADPEEPQALAAPVITCPPEDQADLSPAANAQEPGDILAWAKHNFAFSPDIRQTEILTAQPGRTLILGARQAGKSTATALKVLWEAIQNPGRQILLAAPSARQSGQIGQKAHAAAHKLYGKKVKSIPEGFVLPNGAQILSLPDSEETVRGFSNPLLIVVDEAAFVTDDIYRALLPTQATGIANVILLSTANGQSGFFYEQWVEEPANWTRIQINIEDCPRFNDKFLAQARLLLGEDDFNQEFHNRFLHAPGAIFTREMISKAFKDHIKPLFDWDDQVMQ